MTEFFYDMIRGLAPAPRWILFVLATIVGFVCLIKFADIFVDGASNLAKIFKIPTIVIGLTIVAFGTSAPEASVSITAAISGSNGISVGNIIGSNIFNLFLILAISALIAPVAIQKSLVKRDVLVMLVSSFMLVLFAFVFGADGSNALVWYEGLALVVIFVIYLVFMIRGELKQAKQKPFVESETQEKTSQKKQKNVWITILLIVVSLAGIVVGGTLVNVGAKGIVVGIGASENLAGLTVCAIGTSLPELVTSIVAMKKNENDLAVGNVVGSNMFNVMLILGVCSLIAPQKLDVFALVDIVIMTVLFVVFFVYALFNSKLTKKMAIPMLAIYVLYFAFIIVREYVPIF